MMIALQAQQREVLGRMPAAGLAGHLRDWAGRVNMDKIKKAPPRKPTKQKSKPVNDAGQHLSTARLLEDARKGRRAKTKGRIQS
jgi:hypothetical protein